MARRPTVTVPRRSRAIDPKRSSARGVDDIEDVIRDFVRRNRPIARVVMAPSAFEPAAHPESILMRARRLGLIVSRLPSLESGEAPRLPAVAVEELRGGFRGQN